MHATNALTAAWNAGDLRVVIAGRLASGGGASRVRGAAVSAFGEPARGEADGLEPPQPAAARHAVTADSARAAPKAPARVGMLRVFNALRSSSRSCVGDPRRNTASVPINASTALLSNGKVEAWGYMTNEVGGPIGWPGAGETYFGASPEPEAG